jgi:hypothetical protein
MIIDKHFTGLIKDIYIITDPYYITISEDIKYDSYLKSYTNYKLYLLINQKNDITETNLNIWASKIYNIFIKYNKINKINEINEINWTQYKIFLKDFYNNLNNYIIIYNNLSSIDTVIDTNIINIIDIQIIINNNNQTTNNIIKINKFIQLYYPTYSIDVIMYIIFYTDKYLVNLSENKKLYITNIYLKHQFNYKILNKSRISSIILRADGNELLCELDTSYFSNVIPVMKFGNSLPENYYVYSFSLNPLEDQFTGHLNYTNFNSSSISINSNSDIFEQYNIYTLIKEYNIIKIVSGIGSK